LWDGAKKLNYQALSTVARILNCIEADLLDLEQRKWIRSVAKNGIVFLSDRDTYKARFILRLRSLGLAYEEIERVLEVQQAPYSLAEIPGILDRPLGRLE
jgi:hypothetical protein